MKRAPWLPDVLRAAGLEVVEHAGWERRGRDFADLGFLIWHHDASPVGDSPGVPGYMLRQMAAGKAGAQLWVDRYGTWHVLAAGVAFHAGTVLPGKPGNARSLGVELDHTTGERWPTAQLDSLRRGSAAILVRMGRSETGLEFHSTICHPPGRKTDPDGLSLLAERARVGTLLATPDPIPAPAPTGARMFITNAKGDNRQWLVQNAGASHIKDFKTSQELQAGGVPWIRDADPAWVASVILGGATVEAS